MIPRPEEEKLSQELKVLYPNLTDEQLVVAGEILDTYIDHTIAQFERICQDPERYKKFLALTGRDSPRYDGIEQISPDTSAQPSQCLEKL
jgi:hypothetical protein